MVALVVSVLGLAAVARVLAESAFEYRQGDDARRRDDVPEAIRRFRRAAHWYLPASPWCDRAYASLEEIAVQSEARGRADYAFAAWRAVRSSALATRNFWTPHRERLERANRHLAALLSEMPPPPEDRGRDRARIREEHLARLNDDRAPEPAWVLVMGIGLAAWLGAAVWAARRGWTDDDAPHMRQLGIAAGVLVVGVLLFVLGLTRA